LGENLSNGKLQMKKEIFTVLVCLIAWVCRGEDVQWELVFEENFDGTAVNTNTWSMYNSPGHVGNGLRRPEAFSVEDGLLVVTAQMKDGQLVSGGMSHRKNYLYGKFEFRVRTENDPSAATSGVVLTWPQTENWPTDGENDIYETLPRASRNPFHTYIHYSNANKQDLTYHYEHSADAKEWQTITMEWFPDVIKIYRNGTHVYSLTDINAIPQVPHHLCVQLDAFKTTMTGTVKMYVDWVKIYQQPEAPQNPGPYSDPNSNVNSAGEPWLIPGQIEAEYFDFGGEGVAYHDSDTDNHSSQYRKDESVELFSCSSYGGSGYNIGYIAKDEWWKYTVNVQETGTYRVFAHTSSPNGGSFTVQAGNATPVLINVNTGNYNTYQLVEAPTLLNLNAGRQVMTVTSNGGHNLDYYLFEKVFTNGINEIPVLSDVYYDRITKKLAINHFSGKIRVMDVNGRMLIDRNVANGDLVDVSNLPKGLYLVRIAEKTIKLTLK
jgi:hypothetical protein